MKHLTKSKESLKRNYPLEHQKQIRKYWKNLPPDEKTRLVLENHDSLAGYLKESSSNRDERRKEKLFHMVVSLVPGREELLKASDLENLGEQCVEFMKSLGDTNFIDSLLFPTFEQMASIPRFSLHDLGRSIFKTIDAHNFSKLFTQLEEKDKAKKADQLSKASKKKSSKKSSQKGQPLKEKDEAPLEFMMHPSDSACQKKAAYQHQNSTTTYEEEFQKLSREYLSDKGGWIPSSISNKDSKKPKANRKKRRSNDFTNKASSLVAVSKGSESQKAQSMCNSEIYESASEVKRTMSFSNNLPDELNTVSNNRTLSTKTESKILRSQEVTNIYSKPEIEVREEDDMSNYDETFDRKSNRGSVDHNQNSSSVDPKNRNLRTNSIEREVKKKLVPNARAFKPLQKNDLPVNSNKVLSTKDKKEVKLVNLYSENAIKEIMKTSHQTKNPKDKAGLNSNRIPRNSYCGDSDSTKVSPSNPEKKKPSSNTKLEEGCHSPSAVKTVDKTPTKIHEKKQVYSAMINKIGKWEIDERDMIPKEKSAKMKPVTLNFDPSEDIKPEILPKIDIKKGFQKYLSGPMSLEQGELFFRNYLSYNINECVSRIKAGVNSSEPLRITAFKRVRNIITQSSKSIKSSIILYGSWATGLMVESSDIDICIKRFEVIDRIELKSILETLEQNFKCFKWVTEVKGIYTAMVPVLKLVIDPRLEYADFTNGVEVSDEFKAKFCSKIDDDFKCPSFSGNYRPISVDITVQDLSMSENVGLRTTQYIQQSLGYYPILGDLVILFKTYLASLGLNNTYKGGLGSYAICLLIIAYLEFRKRSKKDDTISEILSGILMFYGTEFNPATHGICTHYQQEEENLNPYFEIPNYLRSGPLVVLDPTQFLIKNITQNAYQISDIQREFAKTALQIQHVKDKFFEELHREMKEQGGVKKDYFLSYHKKKDRVLDMSKNVIEDILYLRKPASPVDHMQQDIH